MPLCTFPVISSLISYRVKSEFYRVNDSLVNTYKERFGFKNDHIVQDFFPIIMELKLSSYKEHDWAELKWSLSHYSKIHSSRLLLASITRLYTELDMNEVFLVELPPCKSSITLHSIPPLTTHSKYIRGRRKRTMYNNERRVVCYLCVLML